MNSVQSRFFDWFKNLLRKNPPSGTFKCGTCGKFHIGLPMDMEFKKPGRYFEIPAKERNSRIYVSTDVCVVDDNEFYIRGVLPIPVANSIDKFRWGLWAKVEKNDFDIYAEYWDGNLTENLPALHGLLSGSMKHYPDSDMTPVEIYLQTGDQRPIFKVISDESSLGSDQKKGITIEKVHSFVELLLR